MIRVDQLDGAALAALERRAADHGAKVRLVHGRSGNPELAVELARFRDVESYLQFFSWMDKRKQVRR